MTVDRMKYLTLRYLEEIHFSLSEFSIFFCRFGYQCAHSSLFAEDLAVILVCCLACPVNAMLFISK